MNEGSMETTTTTTMNDESMDIDTKDIFICSRCSPRGGPPGGCPPQYHWYRCDIRKQYEKDAALERYNARDNVKYILSSMNDPFEIHINKLKMGRDVDMLIKEKIICEQSLAYIHRESLELYQRLKL